MVLQHLNWLAVLVSAVAYFSLGAVWFGPIFGKAWMKAHGINPPTDEEKKKMNVGGLMTMAFINTIVLTILTSYIVMIINYNGSLYTGVKLGAIIGGLVALPTGINYLFLQKNMTARILDGGYHACGVMIVSIIMSVWR